MNGVSGGSAAELMVAYCKAWVSCISSWTKSHKFWDHF